jgi:hypothetical protein
MTYTYDKYKIYSPSDFLINFLNLAFEEKLDLILLEQKEQSTGNIQKIYFTLCEKNLDKNKLEDAFLQFGLTDEDITNKFLGFNKKSYFKLESFSQTDNLQKKYKIQESKSTFKIPYEYISLLDSQKTSALITQLYFEYNYHDMILDKIDNSYTVNRTYQNFLNFPQYSIIKNFVYDKQHYLTNCHEFPNASFYIDKLIFAIFASDLTISDEDRKNGNLTLIKWRLADIFGPHSKKIEPFLNDKYYTFNQVSLLIDFSTYLNFQPDEILDIFKDTFQLMSFKGFFEDEFLKNGGESLANILHMQNEYFGKYITSFPTVSNIVSNIDDDNLSTKKLSELVYETEEEDIFKETFRFNKIRALELLSNEIYRAYVPYLCIGLFQDILNTVKEHHKLKDIKCYYDIDNTELHTMLIESHYPINIKNIKNDFIECLKIVKTITLTDKLLTDKDYLFLKEKYEELKNNETKDILKIKNFSPR